VNATQKGLQAVLQRTGIVPMAGLTLTAIQLDPPAIGIAGLGLVEVGG